MTDQVTISARAKVNLFLRVLAREADGYHGIETLFCRIDLADELTAVRSPAGVELVVEGADTGPPEDNLAVRAARLVLAASALISAWCSATGWAGCHASGAGRSAGAACSPDAEVCGGP